MPKKLFIFLLLVLMGWGGVVSFARALPVEGRCLCTARHATITTRATMIERPEGRDIDILSGSVGESDWITEDRHRDKLYSTAYTRQECQQASYTGDDVRNLLTDIGITLTVWPATIVRYVMGAEDTLWDVSCRWEPLSSLPTYCCCQRIAGEQGPETTGVRCAASLQRECNQFVFENGPASPPGGCLCAGSRYTYNDATTDHKVDCEQRAHYNPTQSQFFPVGSCVWDINWENSDQQTAYQNTTGYSTHQPINGNCDFQHISTGQQARGQGVQMDIDRLLTQARSLNVMGYQNVSQIIGRMIRMLMAFIGSIALALYIYAGFTWMTAAGNPERATSARKILVWTTLGVIVMLASYTLTQFVFTLRG